jgi:hypothetical protein
LDSAGVKTGAIVFDDQVHDPILQPQSQQAGSRGAVPEAVTHGFTRNGQQLRGLFLRQPIGHFRLNLEIKTAMRVSVHVFDQ